MYEFTLEPLYDHEMDGISMGVIVAIFAWIIDKQLDSNKIMSYFDSKRLPTSISVHGIVYLIHHGVQTLAVIQ